MCVAWCRTRSKFRPAAARATDATYVNLVDSSGWASWKPGRFLLRYLPTERKQCCLSGIAGLERCGAFATRSVFLYRIQRMAMCPTRCFYLVFVAGYILAGTTAAQPAEGPLLLPPPMFAAPVPQTTAVAGPGAIVSEEPLPLPTTTDSAAIQLEGEEPLDVAETRSDCRDAMV